MRYLIAFLAACVGMTACYESMGPDGGAEGPNTVLSSSAVLGPVFTTDLIADGGDEYLDIGEVVVSNDGTNISVEYQIVDPASDDWCIVEVHTHVGESLAEFPLTNNGSPKVGQFEYPDPEVIYDPVENCVKSETVDVPIMNDWWDVSLMIAAHAVVVNLEDTEGLELVANGSFETPEVDTDEDWDIFEDGTADLGWSVEWAHDNTSHQGFDRPTKGWLEIQEGVVVEAFDGDQSAELDTDWSGPPSSLKAPFENAINDEPASVNISQSLAACPSGVYDLTYAWRPRPNRPNPSEMEVTFNGSILATHSGSSGDWTVESHQVSGPTEGPVELSFQETGIPNSFGMLLDAVSVDCIREETAWGEGERFVDQGNWAMYFQYTLNECPQVVDFSGPFEFIAPPSAVGKDDLTSEEKLRVFSEGSHSVNDLPLDKLGAATASPVSGDFCSYYVHFDIGTNAGIEEARLGGSLTFNADIVGLIYRGSNFGNEPGNTLCETNSQLGTTGVNYEPGGVCGQGEDNRGLEIGNTGNTGDGVTISPTSQTTTSLRVQREDFFDAFRIVLPALH